MNKILRIGIGGGLLLFVMYAAFGARAPEPPRDSLREPMQPATQCIAGQDAVLASDTQVAALVGDSVLHSPNPKPEATTAQHTELRTRNIFAVARRHGPAILYSLLAAFTLLAGWIGYRHSKQVGMDTLRGQRLQGPHRHRRQRLPRQRKPRGTRDFSEVFSFIVGILIILAAIGLVVFLGNLILGTLAVGFGMATLAIVVATLVIAALSIGAVFWAKEYARNNRRGPNSFARGCSEFFTFLGLMLIIVPASFMIGALLTWAALSILLSFAVTFGTAFLVFLVIAGVMTPVVIVGVLFLDGDL